MKKLYIVTRKDLPAGAQLAQSCHALSEFVEDHPSVHKGWKLDSNNIVCLAVGNEMELACLYEATCGPAAAFHEPDFNGELTALAFTDEDRRLVANLSLALKAAA